MRPDILTPLFASARSLKGVGPKLELFLKKALRLPPGVTEPRLIDLLWHSPTAIVDRSAQPSVAAAVPGTIATLKVRVLKHRIPHARQQGAVHGRNARTTAAASTSSISTSIRSSSPATCRSARSA